MYVKYVVLVVCLCRSVQRVWDLQTFYITDISINQLLLVGWLVGRFTLAFLIFYLSIYLCVFIHTGYWYRKWSRHVRSIINGDAHCPSRASDSPHAIHKPLSVVVRWPQRWLTTSLWYILSLPIQEALPSLLIEVQRYILSVVKDCLSLAPPMYTFFHVYIFFRQQNKKRTLRTMQLRTISTSRSVFDANVCVCVYWQTCGDAVCNANPNMHGNYINVGKENEKPAKRSSSRKDTKWRPTPRSKTMNANRRVILLYKDIYIYMDLFNTQTPRALSPSLRNIPARRRGG